MESKNVVKFQTDYSNLSTPIMSGCFGLGIAAVATTIISFAIFKDNERMFTIFSPANILVVFIVIGTVMAYRKRPSRWKKNISFDFDRKVIMVSKSEVSFAEVVGYRAQQQGSVISDTSYQVYLVNRNNKLVPLYSTNSIENYSRIINCLQQAEIQNK